MTEETLVVAGRERLDIYLSGITEYTRSHLQKLIKDGSVTVNDKVVKSGYTVMEGDRVHIVWPDPKPIEAVPEEMDLSIVYEDEDICVIDKPQGMVVHPAPGHENGTLVNGLLYHFGGLSTIGGEIRPGIVHRIDKMTSGLLAVAKNDASHISLAQQFKEHTAGRTYVALVEGNIKEDTGTVSQPIARHPQDRKRMAVDKNGRHAVTHWEVLARFGMYTLVRCRLETGRTHQIRVHMAYIHHPLVGDTVYGRDKTPFGLEGQALHGYQLRLVHPVSREEMLFKSPLPDYFSQALRKASRQAGVPEVDFDKEYLV